MDDAIPIGVTILSCLVLFPIAELIANFFRAPRGILEAKVLELQKTVEHQLLTLSNVEAPSFDAEFSGSNVCFTNKGSTPLRLCGAKIENFEAVIEEQPRVVNANSHYYVPENGLFAKWQTSLTPGAVVRVNYEVYLETETRIKYINRYILLAECRLKQGEIFPNIQNLGATKTDSFT